jgi:hypothetical protein
MNRLDRQRRRGYPSEGHGLVIGMTALVLIAAALVALALLKGWT